MVVIITDHNVTQSIFHPVHSHLIPHESVLSHIYNALRYFQSCVVSPSFIYR